MCIECPLFFTEPNVENYGYVVMCLIYHLAFIIYNSIFIFTFAHNFRRDGFI